MNHTRQKCNSVETQHGGHQIHRPHADQLVSKKIPLQIPHEQIAVCAYGLWQQEGCLQDRDLDTWLKAETQLKQEPPRG